MKDKRCALVQGTTGLSETERQKTPGSLYHIQQKQITSVN